jgi:MFS family permease
MAGVNLAAGAGQVVGPVVAGLLLERTAAAAMAAAAGVALLAAVPALLLKRLAPFGRSQATTSTRVTRRPEVRTAVWAGAVCGGWRGLMGTYAPVLLQQAGHAASAIGVAVAAANVATIAAGWLARWLRAALVRPAMVAGMLAGGAGLVLAAVTAGWWAVATLGLVVSGLGIGLLQTIGPAAASDAVPADDRGDAIAAVGLYRAGALFVAPFGVAGLLLVMSVGPAVAVAGGLLALPAVSGRSGTPGRRARRG